MKARSKAGGKFACDERGVATIEFVVTLPLLVGALAFAFEFGSFYLAQQETVNNVRSAARFLARSTSWTDSQGAAETIVRTGRFGGTVTPEYLNTTNATVEITQPPLADFVTISVRANYPLTLFGLIGGSGASSIPFNVRENIRPVGS